MGRDRAVATRASSSTQPGRMMTLSPICTGIPGLLSTTVPGNRIQCKYVRATATKALWMTVSGRISTSASITQVSIKNGRARGHQFVGISRHFRSSSTNS